MVAWPSLALEPGLAIFHEGGSVASVQIILNLIASIGLLELRHGMDRLLLLLILGYISITVNAGRTTTGSIVGFFLLLPIAIIILGYCIRHIFLVYVYRTPYISRIFAILEIGLLRGNVGKFVMA